MLTALLLSLCTGRVGSADEANELPTFIPLRFSDAALAELTDDKSTVSVITSKPKMETRTRTVAVQRVRSETRTRLVNVDGKPTEQSYQVQVPYTEQVEQTYTVRVPGNQVSDPIDVPLNQLKGWNINGAALSPKALGEKFSKPTAVLLLQKPWPDGAEIEPSHHALLRSDVVLLYSPMLRPGANAVQAIPAIPLVRPIEIRARN